VRCGRLLRRRRGLATGPVNGQAFVSVYKRGIWRQAAPAPGLENTLSEVLAGIQTPARVAGPP
jgi:hypothetical protein